MNNLRKIFFTSILAIIAAAPAYAGINAVNISVGSNGSGSVGSTIDAVSQLIGDAVMNGIVHKYIVRTPQEGEPIPVEGGLNACAESGVAKSTPEKDGSGSPPAGNEFDHLIQQLRSIQPESGVFLNVEPAESCEVDVDTDPGSCPKDAFNELEWLNNIRHEFDSNMQWAGEQIIQYEYDGGCVFLIDACHNCPDNMTHVYNAAYELICQFGGIAGLNTCPGFNEAATNERYLYNSVHN
jgi:hypothetical protein